MATGVSGISRTGVNVTGLNLNLTIPGVTVPIMGPGGPILGGGLTGYIPNPTNLNDQSYTDGLATNRFTLREAWNTKYVRQLNSNKRIVTPFRAVNNAGDVLSRVNYSCGGSCQTFQSRPGLRGLQSAFGSIQSRCDGTGVPPSACNGRFVYDSSDYVTYLKQRAVNRNYNDLSYGGNNYSGSQSSWRLSRST